MVPSFRTSSTRLIGLSRGDTLPWHPSLTETGRRRLEPATSRPEEAGGVRVTLDEWDFPP